MSIVGCSARSRSASALLLTLRKAPWLAPQVVGTGQAVPAPAAALDAVIAQQPEQELPAPEQAAPEQAEQEQAEQEQAEQELPTWRHIADLAGLLAHAVSINGPSTRGPRCPHHVRRARDPVKPAKACAGGPAASPQEMAAL